MRNLALYTLEVYGVGNLRCSLLQLVWKGCRGVECMGRIHDAESFRKKKGGGEMPLLTQSSFSDSSLALGKRSAFMWFFSLLTCKLIQMWLSFLTRQGSMSHISLSLWKTPAISRTDESMKRKSEASSSLFQGLPHWVLLSKTKKEEQTVCLQSTFSCNLGVNVWKLILGFKSFVFPPSSPYQGAF